MRRFFPPVRTHLQSFDHLNVGHGDHRVFVKTEVFLSNDDTFFHQVFEDERAMFLGHQHFSGFSSLFGLFVNGIYRDLEQQRGR